MELRQEQTEQNSFPKASKQNSPEDIAINFAILLCHEEYLCLKEKNQIIIKFTCKIFAENIINHNQLYMILEMKYHMKNLTNYILWIFNYSYRSSLLSIVNKSKQQNGKHWNNLERILLVSRYWNNINSQTLFDLKLTFLREI